MKYNIKFKINIFCKSNIFLRKNINYIKFFSNGLEIYAYHTPILSIINNSILLLYNFNNKISYYYIYKAILEFSNNKLNLVTDNLINYKNLNFNSILNKKKIIEKKILLLKNNFNNKYIKYNLKLSIYNNYLNLIKLSKKKK